MNSGEKLYASSLSGDGGYIDLSSGHGEYNRYFYAINGRVVMQVFDGGYPFSYITIFNSAGTPLVQCQDGDFGGDPSSVVTADIGTGYFRAYLCGKGNITYEWLHLYVYRSYGAPRVQGNKLRVIASDFSGYENPGTSKITAALVNVGRVCTY